MWQLISTLSRKIGEVFIERRSRRSKLRRYLKALRVEVEDCGNKANVYLTDRIPSPNYELSTIAFKRFQEHVIGELEISEDVQRQLAKFYDHVHSLNCGIQYAHELRGNTVELQAEWRRNCLKAEHVLQLYQEVLGHVTNLIEDLS